MTALLVVSLLANGVGLGIATKIIRSRGGWPYLKAVLVARGVMRDRGLEAFENAYHRTQIELFALAPLQPGDTAMIGDSLTDACPWHELLANPRVKNRGISGDKVAGVLRRLPTLVSAPPRQAFFMIGINDLLAAADPVRLAETYRELLVTFQQAAPATQLCVISVLPIDGHRLGLRHNVRVATFNEHLARLAADAGVSFLDLHAHFVVDGQLNPAWTYDGLHLNGDGYRVWCAALAPLL